MAPGPHKITVGHALLLLSPPEFHGTLVHWKNDALKEGVFPFKEGGCMFRDEMRFKRESLPKTPLFPQEGHLC